MARSGTQPGAEAATLVDVLRRRVDEQAERLIYRFLSEDGSEAHRLTGGQLGSRVRALARRLAAVGEPGDRALLLYPAGLEFIVAFLGCLAASRVAVPAYPPRVNRGQPRLRAIAEDSRPRLVLTTAALLPQAGELTAQIPELAGAEWIATDGPLEDPGDWPERLPGRGDLAFLQYTSGSTAVPKGVRVLHGSLIHNEEMIGRSFGLSEESVVVGWLPLYHDMGLIGNVLQPLYAGARCVLMSPLTFLQRPARWLEAIARYGAEGPVTSGGPNFAYDLCARKVGTELKEGLDLSAWTVAYNGAEPVRRETLDRFAGEFASCGFRPEAFFPCYGLAEATLFASGGGRGRGAVVATVEAAGMERGRAVQVAPGEGTRDLVSSGHAWMGQTIAVVDPESGVRCSDGEVGEIWLSGPSVADGYWNRPAETAETFGARPAGAAPDEAPYLRTGDLGFLSEGELFVTGRRKELIVLRGRNHYPQDIERTAERAHPALRPGCGAAFAIEPEAGSGGTERLVVVYEAERARNVDLDAAADAVRRAVAEEHEVEVHEVVLVRTATVPKTSSGKIQRLQCRASYLADGLNVVGRSGGAVALAGEEEAAAALAAGLTREALLGLLPAERLPALTAWLAGEAARLARVPAARVDPHRPALEAGLDSLALVELRNAVEAGLGVAPPLPALLGGDSLAAVAAGLLEQTVASPALWAALRPPVPPLGEHPLSHGQRALFFLHEMAPGNSAYNLAFAARLLPPFDRLALRRAFQGLAERHPALRTTFAAAPGGPVQRVAESLEVAVAEVDGSAWTEEELRGWLAAEAARPFDLQAGPVLRLHLVERRDGPVLLLAAHHLVLDLWSLVLVMDDLRLLYAAASGEPDVVPGPPPSHTYADFVAWQADLLASPAGERLWEWWRDRLTAGRPGPLPVLDLPADRPRPPAPTLAGGSYAFRLDGALVSRLRQVAADSGATLYSALLAAFFALLRRHSGQTDLLVGSPASGRTRRELEPVVGYFVNMLAFRGDLEADPPFVALLERLHGDALEGLEHQDFPFPVLVERLQPARDPSRSPLFQAAFVFERPHRLEELAAFVLGEAGGKVALGGLALEAVPIEPRGAQFDLMLTAAAVEPGLAAALQYSSDLFDRVTAVRLAARFETLLAGIAEDPQRPVSELPLLTGPELHQVTLGWNDTTTVYPEAGGAAGTTLHGLIVAQAARTPEAEAVRAEGGSFTYRELTSRAASLARYLRGLGVGPGQVVGVALERSLDLMVALLGTLEAGAAYLPLDPEYPSGRLALMLADSGAPVLLTQRSLVPVFEAVVTPAPAAPATVRLVAVDERWEDGKDGPGRRARAEDVAYVIYTSGSTGRPKGVMVPHRGIVNRLLWMQEAYGLTPADRVLQKTSTSFDVSVWELFWPLLTGAALVMARPGGHRDGAYLAAAIEAEGVTTIHFVPSMLQAFLAEAPEDAGLPGLRRVICSGEALPSDLRDRFLARFPGTELHNLYGPTEASVDVTAWDCRDDAGPARPGVPIGRPIANTGIHLLDAFHRPVPPGVPGELRIGGTGLARGYLGRPELTAERFVPDPVSEAAGARLYRTGDLARHRPDGAIEFLGRLDHQVKVRGFRIELGEIEAALAGHPAVGECVVVARGETGEARLVAYLVPRPGEAVPGIETLRRFLAERLPDSMMPAAFVALPALPLSPNGKVDRRALPEPEGARAALETPYVPPRDLHEELIAAIWQEVLGIERVGIDDNFFALGGDSIRSIQVRSRARQRGLDLSLLQLFQHPTVREQAAAGRALEERDGLTLARPFELVAPEDRAKLPPGAEDSYPVPQLQAGLIFHSERSPSYEVYVTSFHLRALYERGALERAAARVVRRHPILRTAFDLAHYGEPLQVVWPADLLDPVEIEEVDLRHLSDGEQEAAIAAWIPEAKRRRFEWSRPPLLRFQVHLRGADTFQLTLSEPLLDGWSVASLMTEVLGDYGHLARLAAGGGTEEPPERPPLAVGYRDFVALERAALASEEHRAYWSEALAGMELATVPRRPGWISDGNEPVRRALAEVAPEVLAGLQRLAREAVVPIKSVLLGAHLRAVAVLSGKRDVVTGVIANGRPEEGDADQVLGTFLNALPFRLALAEGTWVDLARGAFEAERRLLPFRRYPMAQLQRERGGAPLFETAFNFTHFHVYQLLRQVEGVEILGGTASDQMYFPLTIQFNLDLAKPRLIAALDCDGNDMTEAQVQWALELYLRVLAAMAEGPDRRHDGLDFLSAAERHQVLVEWNDTGRGGRVEFVPVHERLAERAAAAPGTLAVAAAAGRLTYGELYERASRLALRLTRGLSFQGGAEAPSPAKRGRVGEGVSILEGEPIVGILIERSPDMIVALAGTLLSGAAYLPLDPAYPRERLAYMLADSGARVLLTAGRSRDLVPSGYDGEVIDLAAPGALAEAGRFIPAAVPAERLAYVIYTSGSTGRPKGVEVSHGGLANLVGWHRAAYGVTPLDRATQLAGTGFDASVWEVWPYLAAGASLHLPDESTRLSPKALLGWLAREAVTLSFLPTALAEGVLAEIAGGGVPPGLALHALLTGGDRLHRPPVESLPFRLVNHYGPTESTVVATCAEVDLDEAVDLAPPIGRPIAELRVRLLDRAGLPVAAGVAGELYVGGASLARGYRGRPGLTAERFVPDPLGEEPGARLYRTGDLARHRPDGALDFLGRADAQVKVRGVRIELGEIEQGLLGHPAVREAAALARQDEPGGETRLVAYVVLSEEAAADPEATLADLRRHLRESLPEAMVPAAFVPLAALPLTANGKLDRVALPAPERTRRVTDSTYMPPRDPVEQGLAEIWAEVLRLERVGVQDDFFALGGHSLLATQLISRVRERFEVEVPITALFDHPTVEGLAVVVEELRLEQEDDEELARMLAELDNLSDEEARERLAGGARIVP